eukprot:scaffold33958_cov136-Isochrysis_galbana.AAC.3
MKTTLTSALATCRFDEDTKTKKDPENSDGAGRDRSQALASDPSAPMGPREDIFSTSGAPESRMNTTSTSAPKSAQICRKP